MPPLYVGTEVYSNPTVWYSENMAEHPKIPRTRRGPAKKYDVPVNTYVTQETHDALRRAAEEADVSVAEILRRAAARYLTENTMEGGHR